MKNDDDVDVDDNDNNDCCDVSVALKRMRAFFLLLLFIIAYTLLSTRIKYCIFRILHFSFIEFHIKLVAIKRSNCMGRFKHQFMFYAYCIFQLIYTYICGESLSIECCLREKFYNLESVHCGTSKTNGLTIAGRHRFLSSFVGWICICNQQFECENNFVRVDESINVT